MILNYRDTSVSISSLYKVKKGVYFFFFKFLHKLGLKELKGHGKALLSVIDAPKKENANTW